MSNDQQVKISELGTLVSQTMGVTQDALYHPTRWSQEVSEARAILWYLAYTEIGVTIPFLARRFNRDNTTVSHGVLRVENQREQDGVFDDQIDQFAADFHAMICEVFTARPVGVQV